MYAGIRANIPVIISRPEPSSSLMDLMVMFKLSAPDSASGSVRDVRRNFSRASLALEMSSRRKTSLQTCQVLEWPEREYENGPMRVQAKEKIS